MTAYCPVPWTYLHILPNGSVRPCPVFYGEVEKISEFSTTRPSEAWQGMRSKVESGACIECEKCHREEGASEVSQRQKNQAFSADVLIDPRIDSPMNLQTLDVAFSNKCNMSCRFCSAQYSTKWIAERKFMKDKGFFPFPEFADGHVYDNPQLAGRIVEIIKDSPGLKKISIKGGEPLIQKQVHDFLGDLVELGRAGDLSVEIISNFSHVEDSVIETLKNFKKVSFTASIDGTGKVYEYVRGGKISLEGAVLQNILKVDEALKTSWTFHSVINAYNCFNLQDLQIFFESLSLKNKMKWQIAFLNGPMFLRTTVLPETIRHQAIERNKDLRPDFLERLKINLNRTDDKDDLEVRRNFIEFTKLSDQYRQMPIQDYIPELSSIF